MVPPTPQESALLDALRASGELVGTLMLALHECREIDITPGERDRSLSALTRRAYRLAVQVQHTIGGCP